MDMIRVVSLVGQTGYHEVMSPTAEARLRSFAELTVNDSVRAPSPERMAAMLADADACLTGWGVRLPAEAIAGAERLRIIAHMAGSVRRVVPPEAYARGIVVTHAAPVIARSVGEMALGLTLAGLRNMVRHTTAFRQQGTPGDATLTYAANRGLHGARVGLIGASMTGREFIKLLHAFEDVDIWVYDPYLSDNAAGQLGVHKAELDDLLASCDVVSLHAPANEATFHLIGKRELALLQDDALLVNTARGELVDHDALLAELRRGRISAALDVYLETLSDAEVAASPYRELPNVIITPGWAGPAVQLRQQLGAAMVDELARFFTGLEPRYRVTPERLQTMA